MPYRKPQVKPEKRDPLVLVFGSIWAIFVLWAVISMAINLLSPTPRRAAVQKYTPVTPAHGFQEIWLLESVFIDGATTTAAEGSLFFFGSFSPSKPPGNSLWKLNLATGNVDSKITGVSSVHTVAAGSQLVYIGVRGGKVRNNDLVGAARVIAYEADSGKMVWSRQLRGVRGIASLSLFHNRIAVIGSRSDDNIFHLLDAATGRIQYSSNTDYPIYYTQDTWYFWGLPRPHVRAVNSHTGAILWQQENASIPTYSDGIIVTGQQWLKTGAIDGSTGQILWRSDVNVYSNIAVQGETAFFLTEYAELKAVNIKTGRTVASLQFRPETHQERLTQQWVYNVAASGDIVVVYLGDSRQLFAFRFSQGN